MYRTVITVVVLSEDPIPGDMGLAEIARECDEGDYVGGDLEMKPEKLTRQQMASALNAVGSEPGFFLQDDGWKYAIAPGDEINIDSGDNEPQGSVIVQSIEIVENEDAELDAAKIVGNDGQRFECLLSEIS